MSSEFRIFSATRSFSRSFRHQSSDGISKSAAARCGRKVLWKIRRRHRIFAADVPVDTMARAIMKNQSG